jgi:hypothetical protein
MGEKHKYVFDWQKIIDRIKSKVNTDRDINRDKPYFGKLITLDLEH